ncbi:MAG: nuclear transport factor 2 family protein [Elainella sp. Prado103]|jgi:uncharacterized protein (TIGR02246 family)|nr:nuclear transport factor 2 family protein [Elainella sp. Prado103]
MAGEHPDDRLQLGRTIARVGVILAVGLAIATMTVLAAGLLPQIFPVLFPSAWPISAPFSEPSDPAPRLLMPTESPSDQPIDPNAPPVSRADRLPQSTEQPSPPTSAELRSIIHIAQQAWQTGNIDRFTQLFMDGGKFVVPGQVYQGQAAIRSAMAEFFASHADVTIQIRQLIVEGSRVAIEWHWEDTEIATGQRTVAEDAIIVEFQGDRIDRWREYIDVTGAERDAERDVETGAGGAG